MSELVSFLISCQKSSFRQINVAELARDVMRITHLPGTVTCRDIVTESVSSDHVLVTVNSMRLAHYDDDKSNASTVSASRVSIRTMGCTVLRKPGADSFDSLTFSLYAAAFCTLHSCLNRADKSCFIAFAPLQEQREGTFFVAKVIYVVQSKVFSNSFDEMNYCSKKRKVHSQGSITSDHECEWTVKNGPCATFLFSLKSLTTFKITIASPIGFQTSLNMRESELII